MARRTRLRARERVPRAAERQQGHAAAVAVRGEHRADPAAAVGVGAGDDRMRADSLQHRGLRGRRERPDGALERGDRVAHAADRTPRTRRTTTAGRTLAVKLGLHIGYWGMGLNAQQQLELVLGGRAARLRLGLDRRGLRLRRGDDPGLARAGDDEDQARLGDLPDARPLGGDDGDDRGDDRPALRRPDAARDRLVAARRWPRAGTGSASPASCSARASTSRSCGWRWTASAWSSTARRWSCRCRTARARRSSSRSRRCRSGSRSTSRRSGPRTRRWRPRSPTAGSRRCSRPSTSASSGRCWRRASRAPATARASTTSTSSRP